LNVFNRRTALRIAAVSVLLASVASPVAWFVSREGAEESVVSLAIEESRRLVRLFDEINPDEAINQEEAETAAKTITGGLFDIAEIYDASGEKLSESTTPEGEAVEKLLPSHDTPHLTRPFYESLRLAGDRWILRVFVPLEDKDPQGRAIITGYFEGVRVVPEWQKEQIFTQSLVAALLAALASLLCGAVTYPLVVHLSTDNARKAREVLDSHISMMEALGRAIAKRDSDTGAHNYRVAWIATRIAETMGLQDHAMKSLIVGSFLHDVGKIGIPDAILLKPGKLTDDEFATMRTHVAQGEEIVTGIGWLEGAGAVVSGHHEKWDGSGYPRRLAGEAIPLSARIFAVADVFDALCSKRPYKEALGFDAAMDILNKDTGRHFDPQVMDAFRPIARPIFDRLAGCSECDARQLLEERVREHFGL
jgi:HD-GYP domain-containing protein (c-di-GMP phosphodiesterase class II)